jgi:hypothetical protein
LPPKKKPDDLFYRMPAEEIDLVTDIRVILAQYPREAVILGQSDSFRRSLLGLRLGSRRCRGRVVIPP